MNLYDIVTQKNKKQAPNGAMPVNVEEGTGRLQIGDPVVISGDVEMHGKTGDVVEVGKDGGFVVVDLYNHGKHSFQASDVEFNDYADSDEEREAMGMFSDEEDVAEGDPGYDKHSFVGKIRRGHEANTKGWGQLGNLFRAGKDEEASRKALRKGNRYYNMTRGGKDSHTPGGFPRTTIPGLGKVDEQGVAEGDVVPFKKPAPHIPGFVASGSTHFMDKYGKRAIQKLGIKIVSIGGPNNDADAGDKSAQEYGHDADVREYYIDATPEQVQKLDAMLYQAAEMSGDEEAYGGSYPANDFNSMNEQGVAEASIPYALSAANYNAEFERQHKNRTSSMPAGGGYRGRAELDVESKEDYIATGRALKKAAEAAGQHIEYGLSGGVMKVFSDSMTTDELDSFIDDTLENFDQGVAENIGGVGAFAALQHSKNLEKSRQQQSAISAKKQAYTPSKQAYTPSHDSDDESIGNNDFDDESIGNNDFDDEIGEGVAEGLQPDSDLAVIGANILNALKEKCAEIDQEYPELWKTFTSDEWIQSGAALQFIQDYITVDKNTLNTFFNAWEELDGDPIQYWPLFWRDGDWDGFIAPWRQYAHDVLKSRGVDPKPPGPVHEQGVAEARGGDVNFGHTVTRGSWVVYNGSKLKRFKTYSGAKAYAEKNGGKVASSEFYADKIQGKQGVEEGTQTVGHEILGLLRQIKQQGHDAMEELYSSCPLLAQYWDQYEGDFRSMVVELSPKTLNRIKVEISAFNQQDDNDEDYYSLPMPNGDRDELDEQGVAEGVLDTIKQIPQKANAWLDSPIKGIKGSHAGHAVKGAMAGLTHGHAVGHAMADADVAEGVQDTLSLQDAAKVLKQYGATNLKTTSNELHFYKNGRPFSVDLIFNDDATRSVSLSKLNSATRGLKGQGMAEGVNPRDLSKISTEKLQAYWDKHKDESGISPVFGQQLRAVAKELQRRKKQGVAEGSDDKEPFDYAKWKASNVKPRKPRGYKDAEAIGQQQRKIDKERKEQGVAEDSPQATFNALKGLKSWQVVIMNNYYQGKYTDYSGRYYYVLATSPEEAKQVVLDNADAILHELLAMKSHNGKKILPRGSAVRITPDRINGIKDGTEAGRMSTAGFKKMFSPQGPMMVKLSGGAIADVQEQEVDETRGMDSYEKDVWASQQGFDRPHDHRGLGQELAHERNNLQVSINGKPWKVFPGRGTADSREEYKYLQSMKEWAAKKSAQTGKKWTVYLTGAEPTLEESDISGLLAASSLNKAFIVTADLAEGGTKRFKVKAQSERVAIEKFKQHHSMAKIIDVREVPFNESIAKKEPKGTGLSNDLLDQYKKAAGISMSDLDKAGKYNKSDRRYSMVNRATKKEFINDLKQHPKEDVVTQTQDSTSPVGGNGVNEDVLESHIKSMKRAGYDL